MTTVQIQIWTGEKGYVRLIANGQVLCDEDEVAAAQVGLNREAYLFGLAGTLQAWQAIQLLLAPPR
ncbi:unnamed protein product, partial [marine sediment metagenome]